jgi:predicted RNase H-like HicB family nuclease
MLTKYMQAAMRRAKYEIIEDDGSFYGYAPDFPGAWANAPTLEECRDELFEVIEDWILISIADHDPLPVIDGIELKLPVPAEIS